MAANGQAPFAYACKCLNIRIRPQPNNDTPPLVEAGFKSVYVGEEGISVAHSAATLRSRSKAVPDSGSPTAELTRYTSVICLICGHPAYRVAQRITPDLSTEEGPVLPTDDWVEKELCKSSNGWIEVYHGCLVDDDIVQAESSNMYSKLFHFVLPGGEPPTSQPSGGEPTEIANPRGPSEQGKKHLPELPALFLPPPFTPSSVAFSHFSAVAAEQSQKLREEAEDYIAQVTEEKVAELLQTEAALKQEVNLIWSRFRESLLLFQRTGAAGKPLRRRGSVSGHSRSVSNPAAVPSSSVRITTFVPTPDHSRRASPTNRPPVPSALSASLKTSLFHYPEAQHQVNGNGNASPSPRSDSSSPAECGTESPARSSTTRVHSPSTASSRTANLAVDAETSIREAYRREMDESKDMATSYRYVMDIEAQMAQQREEPEAEVVSPPEASGSQTQAPAQGGAAVAAAGHSPRVHRSAIKNANGNERSKSPRDKSKEGVAVEEHKDKGKRKVTFDVKPDVTIIQERGEASLERPSPPGAVEDVIFDMDNESDANIRVEVKAEEQKNPPQVPAERVRSPRSHSRPSSNSGLPPQLSSLRPASLPAPSAMRPPQRHVTPLSSESGERSRALRESLVSVDVERARAEPVESSVEITPRVVNGMTDPLDLRETEILKLVAASTPSHRSAWKKNSKAWQLFLGRRDRRASEIGPAPISEEGNYVLDDFDPQAGRRFNRVAGSDVSDEDDGDYNKWPRSNDDHTVAQSLPIPIGPIGQRQFSLPAYQPKTSHSDRPGILVPALRTGSSTTSSSLRRASYAERDRMRALDPGALDFAASDEYEDEDVGSDPETGGKARQRAFKILKARNELPAAGMWRSLA